MRAAWRVWYINQYKPSRNLPADDHELQYMEWVLANGHNDPRRSN